MGNWLTIRFRGNQKGFAALEGFLILVIITVVGGIGWYAIHTKHQTDKILSQADKISQSSATLKDNPVYDKQKTISDITGVIVGRCIENGAKSSPEGLGSYLSTSYNSGNSTLRVNGNYAYAGATCVVADSFGKSGFVVWLRKESGSWQIIAQGQQSPDCKDFDGQGWPSSILDHCYDSVTQSYRAPKS
jgi:hypothetical protein